MCRDESLREFQRLRLASQLKAYNSFAKEAARAAMTLNGLAQKGCRASNNRSLLNSLQQDGDTSGVARERIHRRAILTLLSAPDTERAELPDDIKLRERPPGVLAPPYVSGCLR